MVILNGPQGSGVLPTVGPSGYTKYLGVQFGAGGIGKVLAEQGKCDTTCLVGLV